MPRPWGVWRSLDDVTLKSILAAHRLFHENRGAQGEAAKLEGYDLSGHDFHAQDLAGVSFNGSNLDRADFRDAVLRDATFEDVAGFTLRSFGGADLTNAKLPDAVSPADELQNVAEVSKYVQTLYKILLATTSFALLTVLSARDEDLTPHQGPPTTILPLIQAGVSLSTFGFVMPLIIVFLYIYQQLYMKELWKRLAALPAYFPDGLALDQKAYPLSFNTLVRVYSERLRPSGADVRQGYVSATLIHGPVAATGFVFWFAFLKKHDGFLTAFHILVIYILCFGAYYMQRLLAPRLLGRSESLPGPVVPGTVRLGSAQLRGVTSLLQVLPRQVLRRRRLSAGLAGSVVLIALFSVCAIEDWPVSLQNLLAWDYFCIDVNDKALSTPATSHSTDTGDDLAGVVGANLDRTKLQRAWATRAFLAKADLRFADLRNAHLVSADLREARLGDAILRGTDFQGADLRGADLSGAEVDRATRFHLEPTVLDTTSGQPGASRANLMGVNFQDVKFSDAFDRAAFWTEVKSARNFPFAFYDASALTVLKLCPALTNPNAHALNLRSKTLRNYDFSGAHLQNTDFHTYDFQGANFRVAELWRSNLSNCNLRDANFHEARLDEADFRGARLQGADFQGAHLRGANFQGTDLSGARNLSTAQRELILRDGGTTFPK